MYLTCNSNYRAMVESNDAVSDQDLIDRLSHTPTGLKREAGMIRIYDHELPKIANIDRGSPSFIAIGNLDRLPVELLHTVLNALDFKSLLRFSRTSLRALAITQSLHTYRELMEHAPRTLVALARTSLLIHHSAGTLRAALRSQNCFSCGFFGAYLFLPTCQRCCWMCLFDNKSLWIMTRVAAAECFQMHLRQVDQTPIMRIIPGLYCIGSEEMLKKRRQSVICVGLVKKLALAIYGSEARIAALGDRTTLASNRRQYQYKNYRAARVRPYDTDPILIPRENEDMVDPFPGIASITFASTASGVVEHGLWCRGCDWMTKNFVQIEESMISKLVPNDLKPDKSLHFLALRARSRQNFLRHIRMCYGVRKIGGKAGLEDWLQEISHVTIDQWA